MQRLRISSKKKLRGARAISNAAPVALGGPKLRFVVLLAALLCAAAALGLLVNWLWQRSPVAAVSRMDALQSIRVKGAFGAVTEQQLEEILLPHLRHGFFSLDIDAMRAALLQNPWIVGASISRRWPHGVEVEVEEARPLAAWGQDQVLVASGKLLSRPPHMKTPGLPELAGDAELVERIMTQYQALAGLLTTKDMEVQRLSFDDLVGWQLELVSGVQLRLGHDELLERMHRFLSLARGVLAPHLHKVVRVDTRYSNAVAVQWHDATKKRLMGSKYK